MIRHYIQAFRATLQKIKAEDGVYIKSENIIVYDPDHIISEIPDNGLITKQNAEDLISESGSGTLNGEIVNIFSGTTLTGDPGYVDIDYEPFRAGHGPAPSIFIFKRIVDNFPIEEVNEILYDVVWQSLSTSELITIRVYPHVDPEDLTKSIDDILILIK